MSYSFNKANHFTARCSYSDFLGGYCEGEGNGDNGMPSTYGYFAAQVEAALREPLLPNRASSDETQQTADY